MERLTKKEKKQQRHQEWEEKIKNEQRNRLLKKIGIWSAAVIIFGLTVWGLIVATENPTQSTQPTQTVKTVPSPTSTDIALGNKNGKVILIEYADFQCPACGTYYQVVKKILQNYGNQVEFVYRNFPLTMHQNAKPAAYAAYSAFKQGKFAEMEDLLYSNQSAWSSSDNPAAIFKQYAERIGLNINQYDKDFSSDDTKKFIAGQGKAAEALGIDSTPSFFVNKTQIRPAPNYDDFKKIIEDEINKK
jgi:protein-disulfide isomerase